MHIHLHGNLLPQNETKCKTASKQVGKYEERRTVDEGKGGKRETSKVTQRRQSFVNEEIATIS
jgi:hypothetical protein